MAVAGNMFCGKFHADGEIRMIGASVGGQLNFDDAQLAAKDGAALTADGMSIAADMFCRAGFRADGQIRLPGATIGGQLVFSDAQLTGKDGPALDAERLTVSGTMYCDEEFRAEGLISLREARLGGLNFANGQLDGKDGPALDADGLMVSGDMFCSGEFRANGTISLIDATVNFLSFRDAHLAGKNGTALNAERLTVNGAMFCDGRFEADGKISLFGANVGVLADAQESWPNSLDLDGFTYRDLRPPYPADKRLAWLRRSEQSPSNRGRLKYQSQPYEQLAAYYRRQGRDDEARRVLLATQRARTRNRRRTTRWWGWLQDGLAGYGYAPGRALALLAVAFVAGWLFFRAHHPPAVSPGQHMSFNAALYTLNLLIPVPGLGQTSDWNPHGVLLAVAAGLRLLGWLLAITVIAAITRALSRN
jgi:hypothetical protein